MGQKSEPKTEPWKVETRTKTCGFPSRLTLSHTHMFYLPLLVKGIYHYWKYIPGNKTILKSLLGSGNLISPFGSNLAAFVDPRRRPLPPAAPRPSPGCAPAARQTQPEPSTTKSKRRPCRPNSDRKIRGVIEVSENTWISKEIH